MPFDKILFVLLVCVGSAILVHIFVRQVFLASAISAAFCGLVFTVTAYLQEGQLSIVPFIFGGGYACVISLLVGLVFYFVRKCMSS